MENARLNLRLNALQGRIDLAVGTPDALGGSFDLIMANIYAEVLCALEPQFAARLAAGGRLILSGIMADKQDLIENRFAPPFWRRLSVQAAEGWAALLLAADGAH